MKIKFDRLTASIRVLSGPFAFLTVMLIGSIQALFNNLDLARLLETAVIVYILFYVAGIGMAMILDRVNIEVTDIDRDKADMKKPAGEKHLGGLIDFNQTAENPFK